MTPLSAITGLSPEAADLLVSAGIRSAAQLSTQDADALHTRVEVVAWQRGRSAFTPTRNQLEQWIEQAEMVTPPGEVNALGVDEIPEAVPMAHAGSPAWMAPSVRAMMETTGSSRPEDGAEAVRQPQQPVPDNTWRKVDPSRFATIEAYNEGRIGVQPLSRDSLKEQTTRAVESAANAEQEEERTARSPRRTQRIRSSGEPLSRWVRRGVVHPRPVHTWLGALVSVLWRVAVVTAVAAILWLVTSAPEPSAYTREVIIGAGVLLVLGCMQLHYAGRSRCRICSCNLYFSKNCHKNRKAHLVPGLGFVASAALHLLIFGWFRCMYCGTAIRLQPSKPRRGEEG
jgi:hypothetical protein